MKYLIALFLLFPSLVFAQAVLEPDVVRVDFAQVKTIASSTEYIIPGTNSPTRSQTLDAEITAGRHEGAQMTFNNDYTQLREGQFFYLRSQESADGSVYYSVLDPYRLPVIFTLLTLLLVATVLIGGWQGLRGLIALAGSIALIIFLLIPGMTAGFSPLLVSMVVAGAIIIAGSYITHGFTRTTTSAMLGMLATVFVSALMSYIAVHFASLSGFDSDESAYLNLGVPGGVDLVGILLSGILIGLLGVLYDVAIGQAVAVEELLRAHKLTDLGGPSIWHVFSRSMRIGREHIGALINTLAIAYVGASLPLLLLVQYTDLNIWTLINSERFATEIIRICIGSIGIVLAVPITTLIAIKMLPGHVSEDSTHHGHHH